MHTVEAVLFFILLTTSAAYVGTYTLNLMSDKLSPLEKAVFGTSIGFGLVSLLTLIIGRIQLPGTFVLWTATAVTFILFFKNKSASAAEFFTRYKNTWPELRSVEKGLIIYSAVFFLLAFVASLAPPVSIDALAYHLPAPKSWALTGKIGFYKWAWQAAQPAGIEMLFTLSMRAGVPDAAPLFSWVFAPLAWGAVFLIAYRYLDRKWSILTATVATCSPMTAWLCTSCYVEPATALYALSALYFAISPAEKKNSAIICGMCCGFAASTKLTGLFALPSAVAALAAADRKNLLKNTALISIVCIVLFSPWLIRNILDTGNPVYPFMSEIFGDKFVSPAIKENLENLRHIYGTGGGITNLLFLPYDLCIHGPAFDHGELYGPLIAALFFLIPIAVIKKRCIPPLLFASTYTLLWFIGSRQARLLLPAVEIWLFMIICGIAVTSGALKKISSAIVFIWIGFSAAISGAYFMQFPPVVFGLQDKISYLKAKAARYEDILKINNTLSKKDRVFFISRPVYYLNVPYGGGPAGFQGAIDYTKIKDSKELHTILKKYGFTHIYRDGDSWDDGGTGLLKRYEREHLTLIWKTERRALAHRTLGTKTYTYHGHLFRIANKKPGQTQAPKGIRNE